MITTLIIKFPSGNIHPILISADNEKEKAEKVDRIKEGLGVEIVEERGDE